MTVKICTLTLNTINDRPFAMLLKLRTHIQIQNSATWLHIHSRDGMTCRETIRLCTSALQHGEHVREEAPELVAGDLGIERA
jgi:hypothetical protein